MIDVVNELFAETDIVRRMLVVRIDNEARFDEAVGGQRAIASMLLERLKKWK